MIGPNDRIAVVAPAGVHDPDRLDRGVRIAADAGFNLDLWPDLLKPHRYLAASDEHRLAQLVEAFRSPDHTAVWAARGGFGSTRLLRMLPKDLPPKILIGFSDITALLSAVYPHSRCVHGPVVHSLPITADADDLWAVLRGDPHPGWEVESWRGDVAEGPLMGGNLSMISALCGTPWALRAAGHILVIEDVGESPYRIDRMIQQMRDSGGFDGVIAVIFGEFDKCDPPQTANWSLEDALMDSLPPGIPVFAGAPIGHGSRNSAFQWGAHATVSSGVVRIGR